MDLGEVVVLLEPFANEAPDAPEAPLALPQTACKSATSKNLGVAPVCKASMS